MEVLYLNDNPEIQGNIPPAISQLGSLKQLRIGNTKMGGQLPDEFFAVPTLTDFQAQNDAFSGRIVPEQWVKLTELQVLDLSFNSFTGPLPDIFARYDRLRELKLQGNDMTGEISLDVCRRRGNGNFDLKILTVDCNIECPDCCDTIECVP